MIMEGNEVFLPDDIIIDILKRLPVKFLIRFQCVCKHWKDLIKTPSFASEHLRHYGHKNPSHLIQWHGQQYLDFQLVLLDPHLQERRVKNAPLIDSFSSVRIVGSSNGLLCLEVAGDSRSSHSILLWNPLTGEARQVPRSVNHFKGKWYIGFGFSPILNDYKIVIIYVVKKRGGGYQVNQVEVYSLRTKSWKEVEFGNLKGLCVSSENVTTNGAVYWFGFNGDEDERHGYNLIVSFDIANEVFRLIPMPVGDYGGMQKLNLYGNKLVMICNSWSETSKEYDYVNLLVMEEATGTSGKSWNWTKKFTSSCYKGLVELDPVAIWRDAMFCKVDFRFKEENDKIEVLCVFNMTFNELDSIDISKYGKCFRMFNYVESLVSIDNI